MLARALRRLREQSGRSQEDAAHDAGISTTALARIERCQADPHWMTILGIIEALGVGPDELFTALRAETAARETHPGPDASEREAHRPS